MAKYYYEDVHNSTDHHLEFFPTLPRSLFRFRTPEVLLARRKFWVFRFTLGVRRGASSTSNKPSFINL